METCQFIGTVGGDPEVRSTQNGKKVVSFSIAINKVWYNQQNEKQQSTKWVKCVAWEKTAETLSRFVHKGDRIFVSGEMDVNVWIDKNSGEAKGQLQLTVRQFEFLGNRNNGEQQSSGDGGFSDIPDDGTANMGDIPF